MSSVIIRLAVEHQDDRTPTWTSLASVDPWGVALNTQTTMENIQGVKKKNVFLSCCSSPAQPLELKSWLIWPNALLMGSHFTTSDDCTFAKVIAYFHSTVNLGHWRITWLISPSETGRLCFYPTTWLCPDTRAYHRGRMPAGCDALLFLAFFFFLSFKKKQKNVMAFKFTYLSALGA